MLIVVGILIVLGVLAIVMLLMLIWSNTWPAVAGHVLNSTVRTVRINGRDHYKVDVDYEYSINGQLYRSQTIKFLGGGLQKTEAEAQELLSGIGRDSCTVRYCPKRFTWSYLLSNKPLTYAMLICSITAFAGALLIYALY